ncbi:unnamed protein product [Symbiodinium pilosum]|uniref:Uncharacterized protein n=1 Tax=Symbiodinium pilosum TaxID=2952 RepID=A0A812SSP3_SYMPI|nr:unnamed protein product [Symbiodinium pilosum]
MLVERLDSSQNLTLKSTLLFGFVAAILVDGFPPQKMKSEMCVDVFIFLVPWGICLLFQSMTFAVLYQRGMMTIGHRHLRELQLLVSKQAEEEKDQGETFVEILGAHWHQRRRQLTERLPHRGGARHVAGLAVSAAWGLVARIFAFAPGPPARAGFSVDSEDSDDDWWSVSESSGKMESPPSRIALDYLTMELHAETSATHEMEAKPGKQTKLSPGCAGVQSGHLPPKLHVTEMSNMPEVQAIELYEDQAHRTVVGGSFFTLLCLGFLVVSRLHMRREEYTDHPMAFYARLGIFLPPLMVAAFASLIRPYPDKRHDFHKTGKDFSNPTLIMAATHCGVLLAVAISSTSLAVAVRLHLPPLQLALGPLRPSPVASLAEWSVEQWPMFFNPTGIVALEDALILTTDFRVARFGLREADLTAILQDEQPLPGMEINGAAVVNNSVLVAGRHNLHRFSAGPLAHFPWNPVSHAGLRMAFAINASMEVQAISGLTYWAQKDLLFMAGPSLGVVAARLSSLSGHEPLTVSLDFRLALDEAVSALQVDEAKKLLYALLASGELLVLDLADNPGAVLQRHRLPQAAADLYKDSEAGIVKWTGIASLGHKVFAVTHSPAKIFSFELPPSVRQSCSSANLRRCKTSV